MSRGTEILYKGSRITGKHDTPECEPIYLTNAFNVSDLDELDFVYDGGGYAYNRTCNPNRTLLAESMTYLEGGEDTLICNCGMSAITTALQTLVKAGVHIQIFCGGPAFKAQEYLQHQLGQVKDRSPLGVGSHSLCLRSREHIPHQAGQPPCLVPYGSEIFFLFLLGDGTVQYPVGKAGNGGHGRTQLVGDICNKFAPAVFGLLQRVCHFVERIDKGPHLVSGVVLLTHSD